MYKIINRKKLFAAIMADTIGKTIFLPKLLFKRTDKIRHEEIKEILVIRTAYIGDVIMTIPIIKPLKEGFTDAKLSFLTAERAKYILENNPYIDEIITYDPFWFYPVTKGKAVRDYLAFLKLLRSKYYDLVIEARADIRDIALLAYPSRSRYRVSYDVGGGGFLLTHVVPFNKIKHRVEYHLDIVRFLGAGAGKFEWDMYLTTEERNSGKALLTTQGIADSDAVVGIHPGGRKGLKCWSARKYAEVSDWIISKYNAKVIFTGSGEEIKLIEDIMGKMSAKAVSLAGKTDLRILASLLERFNLFICNDSAPLHIASAIKTPTVAIFGPSKSNETGPYGNIHRVVEKDFPCRYTCDEDVCLNKINNECMNAITPEDLFNAVKDIMNEIADKGLKLPEKILKG